MAPVLAAMRPAVSSAFAMQGDVAENEPGLSYPAPASSLHAQWPPLATLGVWRDGLAGGIGGGLASSQCQLVGAMTVQILPVCASLAACAPNSPRFEALRASCDQCETVRARSVM